MKSHPSKWCTLIRKKVVHFEPQNDMLNRSAGKIFVHPAVRQINLAYREAGLELADFPTWERAEEGVMSQPETNLFL